MGISRHKNEASIRSYSLDVSEDQRRDMSYGLTLPMANSAGADDIPSQQRKSNFSQLPADIDILIPSTPPA